MKRPNWYKNLNHTFSGLLLKGVINILLMCFLLIGIGGVALGIIGCLVVISWSWLQWVILGVVLIFIILIASQMFEQ